MLLKVNHKVDARHWKAIGIFLLFHLVVDSNAQFNPEKSAFNKIKKRDFGEAAQILKKSLLKDSLNVEANYSYSVLFLTPRYLEFNVDSSFKYWIKAEKTFLNLDSRSKDKLIKFPIDSIALSLLRKKIDSIAFEKAKAINSEEGYQSFISRYGKNDHTITAIELRDESAFVKALKQNSYQSFKIFLDKYPSSHRAQEAKSRYEKLLFESKTKNKTIQEFKAFEIQNPKSPYRLEAIRNIFELSTVDGSETNFENFIRFYPHNIYAHRASDILLHQLLTNGIISNDSLRKIYPIKDWLAILEAGHWTFMDETGHDYGLNLKSIQPRNCSPVKTDFIIDSATVFSRNGKKILNGQFKSVVDLGAGYVTAQTDSSTIIAHKGGWQLDIPNVTDAKMLGTKYIAVKSKGYWGVMALNGTVLTPFTYDRILNEGNYFVFIKSGKQSIIKRESLLAYTKKEIQAVVADEVKGFGKKYIWVRNGALEKVLDENLNEVIPFDRHKISYNSAGLIARKNGVSYLYGWSSLQNKQFKNIEVYEPWMLTSNDGKYSLYHIPTMSEAYSQADSIWFDQSFACIAQQDSIILLQSIKYSFTIPVNESFAIKRLNDSTIYVITHKRNQTVVLTPSFKKLFSVIADDITPLQKNIFLIKINDKQGVVNEKGQFLLKPVYDAILYRDSSFALLKDKKFGAFNPSTKETIKPEYESNILPYSRRLFIAKKGGKQGFINPTSKHKPKFEFDEISYWNDSIALVIKDTKRSLFSITENKFLLENISEWRTIKNQKQTFAIFTQNKKSGLIESASGIILKPEFDELTYQTLNGNLIFIGMKNLGNNLAELSYWQAGGKNIRKQTVTEGLAYTLLCID